MIHNALRIGAKLSANSRDIGREETDLKRSPRKGKSCCLLTNHDEVAYNPRMVVRSGNESIVRYNRGFILTLHVVGWLLILLAVVSLGAVPFQATTWVASLCVGVPSAFTARILFSMARRFSRSFVAIGPEGVRLELLKFTEGKRVAGFVTRYARWTVLQGQSFKWEEIGDITYDSDKGVCRFRARNTMYELTDNDAPSPRTVAKLMAERKGVKLPTQELPVRPRDRLMPRLTQAAIMGGISLPLMGTVAAGAFWMHSHAEGPYFEAEVGALTVLAVLGITLFVTAIALVLIEVTHRL
jgi:hypothetical protein